MFTALMFAAFIGQPTSTADDNARAAIAIAKAKDAAAIAAAVKKEPAKPIVKPAPKSKYLPYEEARSLALSSGKPFIVFVRCEPRSVQGAIVAKTDAITLPNDMPTGIMVNLPEGGKLWWVETLPEDVRQSDLEAAIVPRRAVEPAAVPFSSNSNSNSSDSSSRNSSSEGGRRIVDDSENATGPWLSAAEQRHLKSLWPSGVPWPDNLKFYRLLPASQQLKKLNSAEYRGFHSARSDASANNLKWPWGESGGLTFVPRDKWRNVTGLAIPKGATIDYWTEFVPVFNGANDQYERRLSWKFPKGTTAIDLLLAKTEDGEHAFEVRERVKVDHDRWDDGVAFRPELPTDDGEYYVTNMQPNPLMSLLKVDEVRFKFLRINPVARKRYNFKPTTTVIADDGGMIPKGYLGIGNLSCTRCHVNSGEQSQYAGSILRRTDTVFSFYPVTQDSVSDGLFANNIPQIDNRWPVRNLGAK